jgi:hypothetical protein
MEEIIRYITEDFIKNLFGLEENLYKETDSLADFVLKTRKETDEIGRRFIQMVIQGMNDRIRNMSERKRMWVVERKRDCKRLTTTLGDVIFFKTLYQSKEELNEEGKPLQCYLVDKVLGLSPNQTMTEDATAAVYKEAVQTNYRKAGEDVSPSGISKGAVKDILHAIKFPPNFQIPKEKKVVEYLYIDADEDHYHLQFQNKKGDLIKNENGWKCNGAISKLIYVYEGIEPEAPKSKRNRLINPHYFCRGNDQDNKELWKEVFDYIEATYDTDKIKRIYINSDGGGWIRNGYRGLSDVTFVLDEFHLAKYISKLTNHMKDTGVDAKNELYECIRHGSKEEFLEIVERLTWCTSSEKVIKRIREAGAYLASNWTAAKLRLRKKDNVVGCSAEGHVYHVLSSRMSTLAIGWSRHGGSQMAHLREYYYNGGDMLELAKYQKVELPMAAGMEEVVLSASRMFQSERTNRSKTIAEYGKYAETMRASLTEQTSKKLSFYLHGKL